MDSTTLPIVASIIVALRDAQREHAQRATDPRNADKTGDLAVAVALAKIAAAVEASARVDTALLVAVEKHREAQARADACGVYEVVHYCVLPRRRTGQGRASQATQPSIPTPEMVEAVAKRFANGQRWERVVGGQHMHTLEIVDADGVAGMVLYSIDGEAPKSLTKTDLASMLVSYWVTAAVEVAPVTPRTAGDGR